MPYLCKTQQSGTLCKERERESAGDRERAYKCHDLQ